MTSIQDQLDIVPCGSYDIVLGSSLLTSSYLVQDITSRLSSTSTFVIITDSNIYSLYGEILYHQFQSSLEIQNKEKNSKKRVFIYAIPAGEASKCREMKAQIEDQVLFPNRCHRDTCIIALGGGVVGDLAGYVASTYMRGVPFVQIPTTLLACVDSSIGGKTGIDIETFGKNLIGAFHMPQRVYIDLDFLKTLPKRELINGMGEIIKAGAIFNANLFDLLEIAVDEILSLSDMKIVQKMMTMAVKVKADVVTQDVKEMGLRAILNFGHSIGHGLEALLQPDYLHGECVAIGMIKEAEIARGMGVCTSATVGRLRRCITAYGLPVRVPEDLRTEDILVKMEVDKKNSGGIKKLVILESIGNVLASPYARAVKDDQIALVLDKQVVMAPGFCATGEIQCPGSKSISNRVLLMAALGKGECRIRGLLHSDDTQVMMNALQKIGAVFQWEEAGAVLVVTGTGGVFSSVKDGEEIYLSNAGTAARFLTTAMTLVPIDTKDGRIIVTGNHRMKERPIAPLVTALRGNNCDIIYQESEGCPPLAIRNTGLAGGNMHLAAKVSSQYVSSVLISAPYAKKDLVLELAEEHPTSLPYIIMTIELMKEFGIDVETIAANKYKIPCGIYQNPPEFTVEVDASSATYPLAFAAITGGEVTVKALGTKSLQGDAQFHSLLAKMGCETSQTETTTTVKGIKNGGLLKAVEIDMETMTDAFMTATVLAAVAEGTTKITGIANQRVKECNRIAVMVTELRKIGIVCGELPDGIWIEGTAGKTSHLKKAFIECHNDHRIAMSFAVLGSVVDNVIITDKECTDKTYPEFWDHLQMHLGLRVQPYVPSPDEKSSDVSPPGLFLIGMRGAGKSSCAKAASSSLNLNLLDTDKILEEELGEPIASFIEKCQGDWTEFRAKEEKILLDLIANPPTSTVISCGGGVIESQKVAEALKAYPYVIHIHRNATDVLEFLASETTRPSLGETHEDLWNRRKPVYQSSAAIEFVVLKGEKDWEKVDADFCRLVQTVIPHLPTSFNFPQKLARPDTFFLSLTYKNYEAVSRELMDKISSGVDALEIRVDLFETFDDDEFVKAQIAQVRRLSKLPIVYTVRSKAQGGAFPDEEEVRMFQLLKLGVRLGCEVVDMETCWPLRYRNDLLKSVGRSAIISSYHAIQQTSSLSDVQMKSIFRTCFSRGRVDVVKVVVKAFDRSDVLALTKIATEMSEEWGHKMPIISLCTTEAGKLSRVLNSVLTPVTHPELPEKAAPGQLSVAEIMSLRTQLGLLPARQFFLFGTPISKSPSPAMHNAAFLTHGLPFEYKLHETGDIHEIVQRHLIPKDTTFGGGSVTIPHKLDIIPHLNELTDAAQAIGAVNTIIRCDPANPTAPIHWLGDNTDWLGILRPIRQRLQAMHKSSESLTALVVGAGGTSMAASYAMRQLGVKSLFIYNRTLEKSAAVAQRFGGTAISELTETNASLCTIDIVVSTIPATSGFTLPAFIFKDRSVVCLDAAYLPADTPFLKHAVQHGAVVIQGYEMLYQQAIEQYLRWHKCTKVLGIDEQVLQNACLKHVPTEQRLY